MKMNVIDNNGTSSPECTACGYIFNTDYAKNPYKEMCCIALGKYKYCPICGDKYDGCQIEGIDIEECSDYEKDWIYRGNK